jgi:hypothetical protein
MPMRTPNGHRHIGKGFGVSDNRDGKPYEAWKKGVYDEYVHWANGYFERPPIRILVCRSQLFRRSRSNVMILGSVETPHDFVQLPLDSIDLNADR